MLKEGKEKEQPIPSHSTSHEDKYCQSRRPQELEQMHDSCNSNQLNTRQLEQSSLSCHNNDPHCKHCTEMKSTSSQRENKCQKDTATRMMNQLGSSRQPGSLSHPQNQSRGTCIQRYSSCNTSGQIGPDTFQEHKALASSNQPSSMNQMDRTSWERKYHSNSTCPQSSTQSKMTNPCCCSKNHQDQASMKRRPRFRKKE